MAISITAADVAAVKVIEQITGPAAEAITKGNMVRYDTSSGKLTKAKGTEAAEARVQGMAITTAAAGEATTAIKRGWVDLGDALTSLDYDMAIYLDNGDGSIGTAAGTVSTVVGRVIPAWGYTTADKILQIDL